MKLILLAGDNTDGRLVLAELLRQKRDIVGIFYEKETGALRKLKTTIKAVLQGLPVRYEGKAAFVRGTDNLNAQEKEIKALTADLILVVGTKKLERKIFASARLGAINLHTGILPYYRGGDAEFWALYHKEPQHTGVTIHRVSEELDAGDIILTAEQRPEPSDDHVCLHKKNLILGAKKMNEAIDLVAGPAFVARPQAAASSRTFRSPGPVGARLLAEQGTKVDPSLKKTFDFEGTRIVEEVARVPSILFSKGQSAPYRPHFCLRIDADEYHPNFKQYYEIFKRYASATSIFFCASSFEEHRKKIIDCKEAKIEVQSHAYYHHTFRDHRSNLRNVQKAKEFFQSLGIRTMGFAAPTGRYSPSLMRALESEGYSYSSDFSYDYLGLPSYPHLPEGRSRVMQIPTLPVSPELFFEAGEQSVEKIVRFYKAAIDEMDRCNLPCIIYGHTSFYEKNPEVLERIARYALEEKKLAPVQMSDIYRFYSDKSGQQTMREVKKPADLFLGAPAAMSPVKKVKRALRKRLDFERLTPASEGYGTPVGRFLRGVIRVQA